MPQKQSVIYEVEFPDGFVVEVEGEAGADQGRVTAQARQARLMQGLGLDKVPQGMQMAKSPAAPATSANTLGSLAGSVADVLPNAEEIFKPPESLRWLGPAGNAIGAVKNVVGGIIGGQADQFRKAYDAGLTPQGVGHALAGAIPFVGPAAANAGERLGEGDVAGAIPHAASALLGVKPLAKSIRAVPAEGAAKAALPIIEKSRDKAMISSLGPTTRNLKVVAEEVAPELAKRGVKAVTGERFDKAIENRYQLSKAMLDAAEDALPESMEVSKQSLLNQIDAEIARNTAAGIAGDRVPAILALREQIDSLPDNIPIKPYLKLKRLWRKDAERSGAYKETLPSADRLALEAKRHVVGVMGDELNSRSKALAAANAEYRVFRKARDVVEYRKVNEIGRPSDFIKKPADDLIAAGLGYTAGGPVGAGVAEILNLARQNRGVRSLKAAGLERLASKLRPPVMPEPGPQVNPARLLPARTSIDIGPSSLEEPFVRGVPARPVPGTRAERTGRLLPERTSFDMQPSPGMQNRVVGASDIERLTPGEKLELKQYIEDFIRRRQNKARR